MPMPDFSIPDAPGQFRFRCMSVNEFPMVMGESCAVTGLHYNPDNATNHVDHYGALGNFIQAWFFTNSNINYTAPNYTLTMWGSESIVGKSMVFYDGQDIGFRAEKYEEDDPLS